MSSTGNRIAEAIIGIQKIGQPVGSGSIVGTVVRTSPLAIRIDDKRTLPAKHFILSKECTNYTVSGTGNVTIGGTDYPVTVSVPVFKALAVGDKVNMFSFNSAQIYYVAGRV